MTELQKELESLSYRDIQARAKKLGLAANKKREELVAAIINASPIEVNTEICETVITESDNKLEDFNESKGEVDVVTVQEDINDTNSVESKLIDEIESKALVTHTVEDPVQVQDEKVEEITVEEEVEVAEEPMTMALETSVQEEVNEVEELIEDIKIESSIMNITTDDFVCDIAPEAMIESDSPHMQRCTLFNRTSPHSVGKFDEETNHEYEEDDFEFTEEDVEEYTNNFINNFTGLNLNGLPSPKGSKTIFEEVEVKDCLKIFWGNDVPAYDANAVEDKENVNTINQNKKSNSHLLFPSPVTKVGSTVHWRYEDYEKNKNGAKSHDIKKFDSNNKFIENTRLKKINKNDRYNNIMKFWLSKGNQMPLRDLSSKKDI